MIFRVPAFPMVRELYWTGEVGKWNDHSISVPQITVANIAAVVCISTHWCDSWLPLDISLYYRPDFYCNIYGKTLTGRIYVLQYTKKVHNTFCLLSSCKYSQRRSLKQLRHARYYLPASTWQQPTVLLNMLHSSHRPVKYTVRSS